MEDNTDLLWEDEKLIHSLENLVRRMTVNKGLQCDCVERDKYLDLDWEDSLGIQPKFNCGPLSLCVDRDRQRAANY